MRISDCMRDWIISPVIAKLNKMEAQMANDRAALDAKIAQETTDIQALVTAVQANSAAIAALKAAIVATGNTDFTDELNNVTAADQAVQSAVTDIGTADAQ